MLALTLSATSALFLSRKNATTLHVGRDENPSHKAGRRGSGTLPRVAVVPRRQRGRAWDFPDLFRRQNQVYVDHARGIVALDQMRGRKLENVIACYKVRNRNVEYLRQGTLRSTTG